MSDSRTGKVRLGFAALAVVLIVAVSALGATLAAGATPGFRVPAAAPTHTADTAARGAGPLSWLGPVGENPYLIAAVADQLSATGASSNPVVRLGASTTHGLGDMTGADILRASHQAALIPYVTQVETGLAARGLTTDVHLTPSVFGSLQNYLVAAGEGCLTGGISAGLGALATKATVITTAQVGGTSISTVATKTSVPVFILTCAIGAAAGLIIFQNGLSQATAGVDYANLWANFAEQEITAYYNYVNLTNAEYASLASLAGFAQVGFDRQADNGAALQLGNSSFNVELDELQTGLGREMGTLVTQLGFQLAGDFLNLPIWLDALSAPGAFYAGFGCMYLENAPFCPVAGRSILMDGTTYSGALGGGLIAGAAATQVSHVVFNGFVDEHYAISITPTSGSCSSVKPCLLNVTGVAGTGPNGGKTVFLNFSSMGGVGVGEMLPFVMPVGAGDYNITAVAADSTHTGFAWSMILPWGYIQPTLGNPTVGVPAWVDFYILSNGAQINQGVGGHCVASPISAATNVAVGMPNVISVGTPDMTVANSYAVTFKEYSGDCTTNVLNFVSVDFTTVKATAGLGFNSYNAYNSFGATIAGIMNNATLNAQTYWSFLRALGYRSVADIPADCLIPAPYQMLPSNVNIGNLTLNQSMAIYQAFLKGMGQFYGVSGTFHVCGGTRVAGFNWTDVNWSSLYVRSWGGVYLTNSTTNVGISGHALPSEVFGNIKTWAVPVVTNPPTFINATHKNTSNASLIIIPTLKSVAIPLNATWEVPSADPLWVIYAKPNASQPQGYDPLTLLALAGNGTKLVGAQTPAAGRGDALFVTGCLLNNTPQNVCPITVSNFTIYVSNILCGGACNFSGPSTGGGGGAGTACSGATWPFLGPIISGTAGFVGFGAIGCVAGLIAAVIVVLIVVAIVIGAVYVVFGRRT